MLSKDGLKTRILTNLVAQGFQPENSPWIGKLAGAIADAVVDEITADAELVPVTTDSGAAGAGIVTGKVQ